MEIKSIDALCTAIARTQLLTPDKLRELIPLWRKDEGSAGAPDPDRFLRWLVKHGDLTDYQAERIARGSTDNYFIHTYRLLDRIGRGRMAGIYKAQHPLGQIVAIKVLPPSRAKDPQCLGRFKREARLALKLKHPNVVRTFQFGRDGALYYLVMEMLAGETLEEVLKRRGRLPASEAVRLAQQAFQGLQHLHDLGIVHRDLAPGNLMLVGGSPESTTSATLKILDVGLGKALFEEEADLDDDHPVETLAGTILGTPDYMAPEQARNASKADVRSDLYSMGCILYHMLTGRTPFSGNNVTQKLLRHSTEKAAPLHDMAPETPPGLQEVLDRLMAKDPAQRFAVPEHAARALAAFLQDPTERVAAPVADPQLRDYEKWLDANGVEIDVELVPDAAPTPPPTTTAPLAVPVNAPPLIRPRHDQSLTAKPVEGSRPLGRDLLFLVIGGLLALVLAGGAIAFLR